MAERSGPIRSSASAVTVPGWRTEDFLEVENNLLTAGVVGGKDNELAVVENSGGANMTVQVQTGMALVEFLSIPLSPDTTQKTWYRSSAVNTLNISAADPSDPRIDRVVIAYNGIDPNGAASDFLTAQIIEGTPASSPSAPAVPSGAIPLYQVLVGTGVTTIVNANLTDEREFVDLADGVLPDAARVADLASVATGKGASTIGVEDSGGNYTATNVEDALAEVIALASSSAGGPFGDGSDGDVTISSDTDLARDMFYNNLTVNNGITLSSKGFRVFCAGTITLTGTGKISGTGAVGTAGGNTGGAGGGGAAVAGYTHATAGSNGGAGANLNGGNGTGGAAVTGFGSNGAAGGAGGTGVGSAGTAGAAGTLTPSAAASGNFRSLQNLLLWRLFPDGSSPVAIKYHGGAGGGGAGAGGNAGNSEGGGGGGGGASGYGILVAGRTITGTGNIESKGGNGGNGGNGNVAGSNSRGGGGGGGGGAGALVCVVYGNNASWSGNIVVTGGTGGTGGTGQGGGGTGSSGSNGPDGVAIQLQI